LAAEEVAILNGALLGGMRSRGRVPARENDPFGRHRQEVDLLNLQRQAPAHEQAGLGQGATESATVSKLVQETVARASPTAMQASAVAAVAAANMVQGLMPLNPMHVSMAAATHAAAVAAFGIIERLRRAERLSHSPAKTSRPGFPRPVIGALSENSKRIIGEHGVQRFEEFKRYHDGWDYGRGRALSPRSVAAFESFLRRVPELAAVEPSLFLTAEGNLQLGWEDEQGRVVEVDFLPNRIDYFIESSQEEGSSRLDALPQLIERIRPTIR